MQFRDLQRQYERLKLPIDQAMADVVASGRYIMGVEVMELEKELASYVGTKHCISCGNGTDALYLALRVWDIGKGDAVFVPDFTFFATAEVVAMVGATPIFVDVDKDTFNISASDLKVKVDRIKKEGRLNPRAIIAVDLFGLPANFEALRSIAQKENLYLLEDGAQGFGGSLTDQRACSFGDISTTSFFPAKPLGCYGDGGAIFTDNDDWANVASSLRAHGKGRDKYSNIRIGVNSRLDAIQAAILRVKLQAFKDHELQLVNEVAEMYAQYLGNIGKVVLPKVPQGYTSSWAQYTIRLDSSVYREKLKSTLAADGVPSMVYYPIPLHRLEAFGYLGVDCGSCPVASVLSDTVLSLPIHPYMMENEVKQVVNAIKKCADE